MKTCSSCKIEKNVEQFAWINKSKGKLHYQCNDCRKDTAKRSYKKRRLFVVSKSVERGQQYREQFRLWKSSLSCCMCGENEPECLDFHHVDPLQKDIEIAVAYAKYGIDRINQELKKCIVVCANCHRKIHAGKLNLPMILPIIPPLTKEYVPVYPRATNALKG